MKTLRWIFLVLYIAVIIGLSGLASLQDDFFWILFLLIITIISQVLFIFGAGTTNLCAPVRPRRLILPVIIASLMMTVLIVALFFSLSELLYVGLSDCIFWITIGLSWIAWSIVFLIWHRNTERYKTLRNLISTMIAGSLLELLATVPSHIIVSRRPGCLVGMSTSVGITGGIVVMLWAFGPGIILLFLCEKRNAELHRNAKQNSKLLE